MKAEPEPYFEYNMLLGVEPATRDRILSGIHPTRRARRSDYLSRIACEVLLVHGALSPKGRRSEAARGERCR